MTRTRTAGLALLLAALLVAGCGGGGGGGEPTVTQTIHDELQAELDAALAELAKEKTARDDTESEVARLRGNLTTANTQAATLESSLATATAEVTRLEGVIGDANDTAAAAGSLHAQLNAATAEVTRLEGVIGDANDTAAAAGSLHAQLNAATAEVTELTNKIGSAADAESLEGMLAVAKTRVTQLETLIGDPITPAAESLRGKLATATAKVTELEALVGSATDATSLQGKLTAAEAEVTRLTTALETEKAEVARLTTALATAQAAVATATQQAQQATQQAQQQAQGQEANQRAQNLKKAFFPIAAAKESPVGMTVTDGRLTLTRGAYREATLSGNGLRSATMALTRGTDSGKMVVYTDRELSRSLLAHFDKARDINNMARLKLDNNNKASSEIKIDNGIPHFSTTPPVDTRWRIDHEIAVSVADRKDAVDKNTEMAASYTGYLYGVSGLLICDGVPNCQVQVKPNYAETAGINGQHALLTVTVNASEGATLYFEPGSSPLQLYEGGPVGVDKEYMVFGYWREDPTSAAGVYQFEVFAQAFPSPQGNNKHKFLEETSPLTYDGVAVGAYVEQDPNDPVDTHRQGEFTADVFLEASGSEGDDFAKATITGTIDDFVATPTGGSAAPRTAGRWVVMLELENEENEKTVQLNLAGGGADTEGSWTHEFVPSHKHAVGSDLKKLPPPAVTGVFDARIKDFVHILGAYGAEKR